MFLSLLKNMAECFMKAIRGLSFSSTNEHQPYVNKRNFSAAAAAAAVLGGAIRGFSVVGMQQPCLQVRVWAETGVTSPLWLWADVIEREHERLCSSPLISLPVQETAKARHKGFTYSPPNCIYLN